MCMTNTAVFHDPFSHRFLIFPPKRITYLVILKYLKYPFNLQNEFQKHKNEAKQNHQNNNKIVSVLKESINSLSHTLPPTPPQPSSCYARSSRAPSVRLPDLTSENAGYPIQYVTILFPSLIPSLYLHKPIPKPQFQYFSL